MSLPALYVSALAAKTAQSASGAASGPESFDSVFTDDELDEYDEGGSNRPISEEFDYGVYMYVFTCVCPCV